MELRSAWGWVWCDAGGEEATEGRRQKIDRRGRTAKGSDRREGVFVWERAAPIGSEGGDVDGPEFQRREKEGVERDPIW